MSVLAHIGRGVDKQLITAIVRAGSGQKVLQQFSAAPGVLSISHHHARGIGGRRQSGRTMPPRAMDVLILLVETEHAERLFAEIHAAAGIGQPGGGLIFVESVLRGHPMLPFDGADW